MKTAYFDCFAGISGDMVLGALIDAGVDIEQLKSELTKLNLDGWQIKHEQVVKNGITGTKVHVITEEQHAHRHLKHIVEIIDGSSLNEKIKDKSKNIFRRLAEAEAKVHNTTPEKIHFHEVGAIDAIIDIVGSVICLNLLGIDKVIASKIHIGTGFVECQHGTIPLPAPATVELLKGIPVYSTGIKNELTTPTGAAIISVIAESFGEIPPLNIKNIGYGSGSRDLEIPNMLRVLIGNSTENGYDSDIVSLIETNIDDMNPEFFEFVIERLFKAGALDVYLTPIIMKKSRPATLVSVLSPNGIVNDMLDILFIETTTFGIRIRQIERRKLKRKIKIIKTKYGEIRVKIGLIGNQMKSIPEYEDCKAAVQKYNVPIVEVYNEAVSACSAQNSTSQD